MSFECVAKYCRCERWDRVTGLGAGSGTFLLAEPCDTTEALAMIRSFHEVGLKIRVLGGGMNYAGSDLPMEDTVFMRPAVTAGFSVMRHLGEGRFFFGTACRLSQMVRYVLEHSYGGCTGLSGIPGMLGGALAMNAGAKGVCMRDFLEEVNMISLDSDDPLEFTLPVDALAMSYRHSPFLRNGMFVTGAVMRFPVSDKLAEEDLLREENTRRQCAPKGRSAGSVFQNPPGGEPAGKLLEDCGCKNMRNGLFHVSEAHANWILRDSVMESAPCADLIALIRRMRSVVSEKYKINLMPEVRFANMVEGKEFEKSPVKVLILKGGCSSERDISLLSGGAIADALRQKGYEVSEYDIQELRVTPEMQAADIVWPVLHGGFGEDGRIQKLLEDAGIPFVGSGSEACALLMDKVASKKLMDLHGIPNARYAVLAPGEKAIPEKLRFPLVVKPVAEGSTFGLSVVECAEDWEKALDLVFQYGELALVEEFFSGVEVTIGILSGKVLPIIEIRYDAKVYDFDAKYLHQNCDTQYLCNAPGVPEKYQKILQDASLKFYEVSGARDVLRVDLMINVETGDYIMLEGNSIPGCTANSLVPKAAKAAGMSFPDMCALEVEGALSRYR